MAVAQPAMLPAKSVPGFDVVRAVGEGGSGIVLEARATSAAVVPVGSVVALKLLRPELALSERERRRFVEEARRMTRVDHEGLVRLLAAGVLDDGCPYLAMPLIRGQTLAKRLSQGPLDLGDAVRIFCILARAVGAMHRAGMVHRDIKPENVLLEDPAPEVGALPRPILLDFGIARDDGDDASTTTAEGRIRGTPAYMAPERFFGAVASPNSDVYELGVVLYMMLVGRLPWGSHESVAERLDPPSPSDVCAGVPRDLALLVLRALSTRPEVRPQSADAFAEDVERSMSAGSGAPAPSSRPTIDVPAPSPGGRVSLARATGRPEGRTRRRHRAPLVLLGALALVALAASRMGQRATGSAQGIVEATERAPSPPSPPAAPVLEPRGSAAVSSAATPPTLSESSRPPRSRSGVRPTPKPAPPPAARPPEVYFEDRQ
jgi:serine/threonine-protein kinase